MKKSKLIKTFTAIALGATSIGVIIPIINQITTSTNVNSKSKLNITAKETVDYKTSSLDMLAAKVYTYARDMQGLSEDEAEAQVTHTCGIYNHMYNQQVQQMTQNGQAPNDDIQYGIIQSLNDQFNIDPLDADGMQSNILPNIETSLENQGETPAQAQQVVDNYQSVVDEMQGDLPSNLDIAMQYNTEFQPATANENNLDLVCTWAATQIKKSLSINNDLTADFASKLAVYSPDGKVGYGVGSEITKEDLANLFTFNYDLTTNAWLDIPSCDYQNADTQIYDKVTTNFTETLPLSYLSVPNGATWNTGEILPGYTIHVKITNQDFTTDSNYDKITFDFGVSNTNEDPTSSDVHWLDDSSNLTEQVNVSTTQEKQNIATNYYWKNDTTSIECANEYDNTLDEYFVCDQTKSTRSTIEEILAGAPVDALGHYTVSQDNPYFIDPTQFNFDGINTPPTDFLTADNNHTNEKLMLKIVGINDNTEGARNQSLQCKWCIADTDPQTGNMISVHDIDWIGQGSQYIWVNFNYSEDDLLSIDGATSVCNSITSIDETYQAVPNQDTKKEYDAAQKLYVIDMNLNISTIVAGAALSAFAVVLSLMSGNKTDIISALIAAGLCTAFVSTTAVELANETSNLKALKNADDTMQDTHNDFSKDQINQFRQWAKTLNDPSISISIKLTTAQQEQTFEQNNTDTMNTWANNMLKDNGEGDAAKDSFSLQFDDVTDKIVYWGSHLFLMTTCFLSIRVAKNVLTLIRTTLGNNRQFRSLLDNLNDCELNFADCSRSVREMDFNLAEFMGGGMAYGWESFPEALMSELRSFYGGSNTFDNLGREIPNTDGYIRGNVGEGMVRQVNDSRAQYNEAIADINARERTFDVRIMDNDSWIDGIIAKLTPISEKMPLIINLIVVLNLALSAAIDLVDLIL